MLIAMIEPEDGTVRVHGKSQGFKGLPVRHVLTPLANDDGTLTGEHVNIMSTAWMPTPEELAALNAGANVIIAMWGNRPPPMMVTVGKVPASD